MYFETLLNKICVNFVLGHSKIPVDILRLKN